VSDDAVALIRKLYADAGTGKWDEVAAVMSDNFVIHEPASLPFGGSYHGRDALQRLFGIVMATWIDPAVEIDAIVGDESHVVALLRFTMTSRHSGRRFTQHVSEVSRIEDGKVAEMRVHYFDAAEITREAGGEGTIAA
jgi:ketosteroid isomerase-like protein